jgi:hypothetical protein
VRGMALPGTLGRVPGSERAIDRLSANSQVARRLPDRAERASKGVVAVGLVPVSVACLAQRSLTLR